MQKNMNIDVDTDRTGATASFATEGWQAEGKKPFAEGSEARTDRRISAVVCEEARLQRPYRQDMLCAQEVS